MENKNKGKSGLIFIGISIITIGLIVYFTSTEETLLALKKIKFTSLLPLIAVWLGMLVFDALAAVCFVKGADERLGLFTAVKLMTLKELFNLITPLSSGGQPFLIYAMSKHDISPGKSTSIVVTKVLTFSIFSLVGSIFAFFSYSQFGSDGSAIESIFLFTGSVITILVLILAFVLIFPQFFAPLISSIACLLYRMKIMKKPATFKNKIIREFHVARESFFRYFHTHILWLLSGIFFIGICYFCQIILIWTIMRGLGLDIPFIEGITFGALLRTLISMQPTPGSAGLGEGIFLLVFRNTVPVHLLGIVLIQWRFFSQYISSILGVFPAIKYFSSIKSKKSCVKNE